jgi:hypothetical protein
MKYIKTFEDKDKELLKDKLATELENKLNTFLNTSNQIYVHSSLRKNPWDRKDYYVEIRGWTPNYKPDIDAISRELFKLNIFRFVHNRFKNNDPYVINFDITKDEAEQLLPILDYLTSIKKYNL